MRMFRLSVALQFAGWSADRVRLAEQRATWFADTAPRWAGPLHLTPDRGGSRAEAEGVWPTNRRGWLRCVDDEAEHGATHGWVWQEDMEPTPDFWDNLGRAIDASRGEKIISLLCARRDMAKARAAGGTWLQLPDGTWGGATIMPLSEVAQFLLWEARHVHPTLLSADARVDLWMRATGRTAYATVPSLLQHVGDRSIMGHSGVRRAELVAEGPVEFSRTEGSRLSRRGLNHHMLDYVKEAMA